MSVIGIKYGSYDLQSASANGGVGCRVISTDIYSMPANSIQADQLAERDGSLITQQRLKDKPFSVEGLLRAETRVQLEEMRDEFVTAMSKKNQTFDIDYAGGVRRYLASVENSVLSDTSLTTMAFTISFLSPDGVGWDLDSSELIAATNVSTTTASIPITVGGTYKAAPNIAYVLNSLSGSATNTISIGNGATLRVMSITREWASGDRLEIDSLAGTVFINSVASDFSGQLPTFEPGAGTLSYVDDFSSRSGTITGSYVRRWL